MSYPDRRAFLLGGVGSALTLATAARPAAGLQERPPALPDELVVEFVRAAHADLARTDQMLADEPGLLNATWDWGGGDFETGLGGASHMGSLDIIEFLLGRGARLDLFCAATMDMIDVVQSVVAAFPQAVSWKGPHGISLLRHAEVGKAFRVEALLRSMGAA